MELRRKNLVHSINASDSITNSIPQNAEAVNQSIRETGENNTVEIAKTEGEVDHNQKSRQRNEENRIAAV